MITVSPFSNADAPLITADFTDLLPDTVTLSSATRTLVVADANTPGGASDPAYPDASPSSRLSGSIALSTPLAQQSVSNCVEGCDYVLTFVGTFSNGEKESIQFRLPCRKQF